MLASNTIFEWVSNLPAHNTKMKYHQPTTVVAYVRTLLGHMKDKHDWNYSFEKDFNLKVDWYHS